jgi:hypothetical protein
VVHVGSRQMSIGDNSSSNIAKSSADISGLTSVTSSNSDTKESFMRSHQESEISGHTSVSRSSLIKHNFITCRMNITLCCM